MYLMHLFTCYMYKSLKFYEVYKKLQTVIKSNQTSNIFQRELSFSFTVSFLYNIATLTLYRTIKELLLITDISKTVTKQEQNLQVLYRAVKTNCRKRFSVDYEQPLFTARSLDSPLFDTRTLCNYTTPRALA